MPTNPGKAKRAARREARAASRWAGDREYTRMVRALPSYGAEGRQGRLEQNYALEHRLGRLQRRGVRETRIGRVSYRLNPSGRAAGISALSLAALGVFVYAGYQLLQPILHGTAAGANKPAPGNSGGASPAPAANPSAGWVALNLTDAGAYPFPLESMGARVRQRADLGGTNEYHPGAVFLDGSGVLWKWTGGANLVGGPSGGDTATLADFAA